MFIAEHAAHAEHDLATLRTVALATNPLGFRRADTWVLPCARTDGNRWWDAEIRLTTPVETALNVATSPIRFGELAGKIASSADAAAAEQLLMSMVQAGVLLSELRPPSTAAKPAAELARHWTVPAPSSEQTATDLRVHAEVTLPPAVLREANRAASALVAVASRIPGWSEYHSAFIQRWGPGTAVPLREVLNVLGFPAGYRGSARRSTSSGFTARDRLLMQLAQRAALDGCAEVELGDELIGLFRRDDDRPPIPHTELRFTLAAQTPDDLDRGNFELTVVSGSRHAGAAAGRFLHLLTEEELAPFQQVYGNLPTALAERVTRAVGIVRWSGVLTL